MERLVRDAIAKGLSEICFTDHVDYRVKGDWEDQSAVYLSEEKKKYPEMNVKYPAYHEEIKEMQRKYAGKIMIREGMEFGMQVHTIPQYRNLFFLIRLILSFCPAIRWRIRNFGRRIFKGEKRRKNITEDIMRKSLRLFSSIKLTAC